MNPTTVDPAIPLQRGIYALLAGDAELAALDQFAGGYDGPPENVQGAYVVVGTRKQSIPADVHGRPGRQNIISIDTWTRARSSIPGDTIGARIVALLNRQQAALDPLVDGHTVWKVMWEDSLSLDDPDREVRHRIDRFRIYTAQEEE